MRGSRWVLALTLASGVLAWSVTATPAAAQTGGVRGKVVDVSGKPVEGAKVVIAAETASNKRELKTNKKGEFIQIGLFPGNYTITAEKDGLLDVLKGFRVGIGDPADVTMTLKAAGGGAQTKEQAEKVANLQKLFDAGVAASKAGNYDESIAKFNETLALAPNCQDCYYNIGYANAQKKDWAAAEAAYKKAVELKPDYAEAWNALSAVYNQQKKLDEALAASANAAKYSSPGGAGGGGSAAAVFNQGVILWNQNKFAEAKAKFEESTKIDPNYAEGYYRLGMANVNLGDLPGAVSAFESYLKVAPSGPYAAEVKGYIAAMKK
jgi:tetratricopeptide (TPR) repeat protein